MFVPGDNLLELALSVIDPQVPIYLTAFVSQTNNPASQAVITYAPPIEITGSMQSIDRNRYKELGLDRAKNYMMLYTTAEVKTVARDTNGDHVEYNGKLYECASSLDWQAQDGWNGVMCVEIPAVRKPLPDSIYG